ncbi:hypothetical protein [Nonomuraea sp. NPDC049646]|uniref:hypothetical protein n=1 Tax=unclassified Nonomuraea TaxID=2593643 RepID=UPI0037AAC48B
MAELWNEQHAEKGATEFLVGDANGVGVGGDFGFGILSPAEAAEFVAELQADGVDVERLQEKTPSTTIHGVPGADGPVTYTGDDALPGFENLHFAELTAMAMGPATEPDPSLAPTEEDIAQAKQLLADAEERGEGVQELGHAVAYLDVVRQAIAAQLKLTRQRAEQVYAAAQLVHGTKSVGVTLDDGGPAVATVHIQEPEPEIVWNAKGVLAFARRHAPHQVREVISERALDLPDVHAYIAQLHPEYVRTEVYPVYHTLLSEQLTSDGHVPDPDTGELVKVAAIRPPVRTGQFRLAYTKPKGHDPGKKRIESMFRQGLLGDILSLGAQPDPEPGEAGASSP